MAGEKEGKRNSGKVGRDKGETMEGGGALWSCEGF